VKNWLTDRYRLTHSQTHAGTTWVLNASGTYWRHKRPAWTKD